MTSSSSRSWRARLSRALFGSSFDAGSESSSEETRVSSEQASRGRDEPSLNEGETSKATSPLPILNHSLSQSPSAEASMNAQEAGKEAVAVVTPSSSTSTKRKNLQALLSSSFDDRPATSNASGGIAALRSSQAAVPVPTVQQRINAPPSAPHHQRSGSEGRLSRRLSSSSKTSTVSSASSREKKGSQAAGTNSSSALSTSLTQGVKTLSDMYLSNKEASDTFNQMREREDSTSTVNSGKGLHSMLKNERDSRPRSLVEQKSQSSSLGPAEPANVSTEAAPSADALGSHHLAHDHHAAPVDIPTSLIRGEAMLKVTSKKVMQRVVRIDPDAGQILWDSKKNNRVNLESIREVRTGPDARSYRTSLSIAAAHEERWISIVYQSNGPYKALHLIALSDASLDLWSKTLLAIQKERKMLLSCVDMLEQRQNIWLRQHFKYADTSRDARLDFNEVVKLCRRLGIMSSRVDLLKSFKDADKEKDGFLDFADFQHFVTLLKRRKDVERLFETKVDESRDGVSLLSLDGFVTFLKTEQGLHRISSDFAKDSFNKFAHVRATDADNESYMDCNGFVAFLMSSDNSLLADQSSLATANKSAYDAAAGTLSSPVAKPQEKRARAETAEELIALSGQMRVTQDMSRPLSEYYISSSHNTYLIGGQLTGESTVEGYIRALMQGARSVELDCWDGPNNDPIVTHGHTLTSKVPLREVIKVVDRYAFVASPYPLILSLEVHNGLTQQDSIVTILRDNLGEKLLTEPLKGADIQSLPSPDSLMGKILVKTKNVFLNKVPDEPERFEVVKSAAASSTTDTTTESEGDSLMGNARDFVRSVTKRRKGRSGRTGDDEKKAPMSALLASLLIYTIGVKHRGINKKEVYAVQHMISLSERTAMKYAKSAIGGPNMDDLLKHNRTHLTRIYPSMHKLARLSHSANFLPNLFWSMGCQLVALNWQTPDIGYEMNQAMFSRNASCGYVLKPDALRQKDSGTSVKSHHRPESEGTGEADMIVVVDVTIISAQQLPFSKNASGDGGDRDGESAVIDPYVSIAIITPETKPYSVSSLNVQQDTRRTSVSSKRSSLAESSARGKARTTSSTSSSSKGLVAASNTSPNPNAGPNKSASPAKESSAKPRSIARLRTSTICQNGFNPNWNETLTFRLRLPTAGVGAAASIQADDVNGQMQSTLDVGRLTRGVLDLCFIRFEVRDDVTRPFADPGTNASASTSGAEEARTDDHSSSSMTEPTLTATASSRTSSSSNAREMPAEFTTDDSSAACIATYMISLGAMEQGYHHIPLYDAVLTQHLFSTLFVRTRIRIESNNKA